MNKKGNELKILRNLGNGYMIKEERIYKTEIINTKSYTTLQTSSIGIYLGKRLIHGKLKNIFEALAYFAKKLDK